MTIDKIPLKDTILIENPCKDIPRPRELGSLSILWQETITHALMGCMGVTPKRYVDRKPFAIMIRALELFKVDFEKIDNVSDNDQQLVCDVLTCMEVIAMRGFK